MSQQSSELNDFLRRYEPYIYELRKHLFIAAILFVIGCVVGLFFSQSILNFILSNFRFGGVRVVTTSPFQFIDITFSLSFLVGVFFAVPYAIVRLYQFVQPALKKEEKKFFLSFAPLSIALFAFGFWFGLWIMQLVINLYTQANVGFSLTSYWDLQRFLSQIFFTSLLTGFVFQIPICMSALIRLHILSYEAIASKRRVVYGVLVIIAVLLPTTDILSLVLETLPLFFLFEFGLLLNREQKMRK